MELHNVIKVFFSIFVVLFFNINAAQAQTTQNHSVTASATIMGCEGFNVSGRAFLREVPSGEGVKTVEIKLDVNGLQPGKHAVHLHETGSCLPCGSARGHFDPGPNSNSSPDGNHPFHMGDLINIRADRNGNGFLKVLTTRVTLSPGPLSLNDADGSAFIIHVNPDTYCLNGNTAGCAGGAREACGIITLN